MKTFIRTSTGSYPVITGHGVIGETASAAGITAGHKVTVITDDNVAPLHLEKLLAVLPEGAKHIVANRAKTGRLRVSSSSSSPRTICPATA